MKSFDLWIDVGIPILMLLIGGIISWRISLIVYRKQSKIEASRKTSDDIYIPLATELATTIEARNKAGDIFALFLNSEFSLNPFSVSLQYLIPYTKEPLKYATPLNIQESIKEILHISEKYMLSYKSCSVEAQKIVNLSLQEAVIQASLTISIELKINIHFTEPPICLQEYLRNEHSAQYFFTNIIADKEVLHSGDITIESWSRSKYPTAITPNNVNELILSESSFLERIGDDPKNVIKRLWKLYVMKSIYEKETEIANRIRELPGTFNLNDGLGRVFVKLEALKGHLDREIDKISRKYS